MLKAQGVRAIVIGAGGHARVTIDAARTMGTIEIVGCLDADTSRHGQSMDGVEILGGDGLLDARDAISATHFINGIGVGSSTTARRQAHHRASEAGLSPLTIVHVSAVVSGEATVGHGAFIGAGSIVQAGARIGDNTIINSRAIIEHDALIGRAVHVAPGAIVLGGADVGDSAIIGAGSIVLPGVRVGAAAVVGAGAVVTRAVPDGAMFVGIPARAIDSGERSAVSADAV